MATRSLSIVDAMNGIFQPWFPGDSWDGWRAVLRATAALPMSDAELEFFKSISGGREPPRKRPRENWIIAGRRAGKDSAVSLIAAHAAATFNPKGILRPGERALIACVAPDKDTGRIIQRYVRSYFESIPSLQKMVTRTTDEVVELRNMVDISVMTSNFRSVRGRPILCAILDEVAFLRDDNSAAPDVELYAALLPGMSTISSAQLFGISSPHARSGLLYKKHADNFGVDSDDVLVIQAPSHVLNPVLDTRDRDRQMIDDPSRARAEWLAEFRDDLVQFVDPAVVDRCVVRGRTELPFTIGTNYVAAVDPSGGSSDSMTLAVAHADRNGIGVLDLVAEWRAPFSPQNVVAEIVRILQRYGLTSVVGDAYGGEWPRERFRFHRIEYELAGLSRSEAYLTLLPAINTPGRIELLDNRRLVSQLCGLERRAARSGRDTVDHPRGAHDDVINAAALALVGAALAPKSPAENWIEYYRRLTEAAAAIPNNAPEFGYKISPAFAGAKERVRVPDGISTLYLIDGSAVNVPEDRVVEVSAADAVAFGWRGWERLAI